MASFDVILRSFASDKPKREVEHDWWRARDLTLPEAIRRAALSMVPGRQRLIRHGHQCRLPASVLSEACRAILRLETDLAVASDFDEVYTLVCAACAAVPGTGPLYRYDVSHRIGLHLGIEPDRIYMHTGTRQGAKALGVDVRGKDRIHVSELPAQLRGLSPADAEDVLCIYKSWFSEAMAEHPIRSRC